MIVMPSFGLGTGRGKPSVEMHKPERGCLASAPFRTGTEVFPFRVPTEVM
jgi:hypothetical protein